MNKRERYEEDYVRRTVRPVLVAMRKNRLLGGRFASFAIQEGVSDDGKTRVDVSTIAGRLDEVWKRGRVPAGFLTALLIEFGWREGILQVAPRSRAGGNPARSSK